MSDPYYANVSLLLPMNGANNGTTFTDRSPTPKTITRTNAVTSTAQSKYYGSSGYFDGANDYLTIGSTSVADFGTNPFTIEFWCNIASTSTVSWPFTLASSRYNSGYGFYMVVKGSGTGWGGPGYLGFSASTLVTNGGVADSTSVVRGAGWKHVAVTRDGAVTRLFIDGVKEVTHTAAGTANYTSTVNPLVMADIASPSNTNEKGYLQDLRITKGIARYTDTFTPPSRLFRGISGTILDTNGSPCARTINVYDNATGAYLGTTTSDASTGTYEVLCNCSGNEVFRVVMANESTLYNHIIDRINPG